MDWYLVKEKLPEIGERVLCECKHYKKNDYHVCKFVGADKWIEYPHFDWNHNGFPEVIAWTYFTNRDGELYK